MDTAHPNMATPGNMSFGMTNSFGDLMVSDDLYQEHSYTQLYIEYIKIKKERQTYKLLCSKGSFTQLEMAKYIEKYIKIIERNEKSIERRLL